MPMKCTLLNNIFWVTSDFNKLEIIIYPVSVQHAMKSASSYQTCPVTHA
jgi:hypothetical protein